MAVTDAENQWIAADQPIAKRVDDRLSRADFSKELATAIAGWTGNTSLTVALYGSWGSGKSSVKNMAVEYLGERPAPRPTIIEFNPWRWTNSDELADAFFREVGKGLGRGDDAAKARRLSKLWRKYSASFSLVAAIVSALPKFIGAVLIAAGVLSTLGYVLAIPQSARAIAGLLAAVTPLAAGLLLWSGALSEKLAKYLEAKSDASERSLEERRSDLEAELRTRTTPLIVIVDDIDRLPAERVALMFQLIKAMADLPKFVYLLLFQRDTVEKCLDRVANNDGARFLEKIVQIGLDLPQIGKPEVEKILFDGLNVILEETKAPTFHQTRWGNIYVGGLNSYFRTIRDVKRYLATLRFHIPLFLRGTTFEVNIVDLFAVEAIRLFEPLLYERFRTSKELFTSGPTRGRAHGPRKASLEQIVANASGGRQTELQKILVELFPQIAWAFGGMERSPESYQGWLKALRICSPDVYDKYLYFSVPPNDISQAEIDALIATAGDRGECLDRLRSLHKRGLIVTTIQRLEASRERIPGESSIPFVTALFDFGDDLDDRETPGAMVGPDRYLTGFVHRYLRAIESPEERLAVITSATRDTIGLIQPAQLAYRQTKENLRSENPDEALVSESEADDVALLCVQKIRDAAQDGELYKNRHLATLLYRWLQWDGPEAPRRWVANLCSSPKGALILLNALTHRGFAHVAGDSVGRVTTRVSVVELEKFVDTALLEEKIKQLSLSDRTDDERAAIREFDKALRRRREGKPESDFLDDDDE
jgi:predicted KAP-like P-loop ATPase